MDYKTAGVDVEAGRAFVQRIKSSVEATNCPEVIGGLGGFGGLFRLPKGMKSPVLVSGTDGVGTKLELAQDCHKHFGVGLDLVAMCINDVITTGAKPLFFLDYIATGLLAPEAMAQVIEGIAEGCQFSNCALLGGETAEMPGFYPKGRYDLAGFCVAVVEESSLIDGSKIVPGHQIIGIESSGLHSNGFSLVRKVLEMNDVNESTLFGHEPRPLMAALLNPTKIYSQLVKGLLEAKVPIHGMAHITGGGLPENLPRCLPKGLNALVDAKAWNRPELFTWLKDFGEIPESDIWNTFNLGIGFCLVVPRYGVDEAIQVCDEHGLKAWTIGQVQETVGTDYKGVMGLPA